MLVPEQPDNIQTRLRWSLRVPADQYRSFLTAAENSASRTSLSESTEDVTADYVDVEARLNSLEDTVNPHQLLFGINQGCTFADLRVEHMKQIAEYDLDGYAIGGLAVGEPAEVMYDIISAVPDRKLHRPEARAG